MIFPSSAAWKNRRMINGVLLEYSCTYLSRNISVCSGRKASSNLSRCDHCFTLNIKRRKLYWIRESTAKGDSQGLLMFILLSYNVYLVVKIQKKLLIQFSVYRSSWWNTISACCSHFSGWLLFYVFLNKAICNQHIVADTFLHYVLPYFERERSLFLIIISAKI